MYFFPISQTEMKNLRENIPIVPSNTPQDAKNQTPPGSTGVALPLGHLKVMYSAVSTFIFLIKISLFYEH